MFSHLTIRNYHDALEETFPLEQFTDFSDLSKDKKILVKNALLVGMKHMTGVVPVEDLLSMTDSNMGHYPIEISLTGIHSWKATKRGNYSHTEVEDSFHTDMNNLICYYGNDCMPLGFPMDFPFNLSKPATGYFGATTGICNTSLVKWFIAHIEKSSVRYRKFKEQADKLWQKFFCNPSMSLDFDTNLNTGIRVILSEGKFGEVFFESPAILFLELLIRAYLLNRCRPDFYTCDGLVLFDNLDILYPYDGFNKVLKEIFPNVQFISGLSLKEF